MIPPARVGRRGLVGRLVAGRHGRSEYAEKLAVSPSPGRRTPSGPRRGPPAPPRTSRSRGPRSTRRGELPADHALGEAPEGLAGDPREHLDARELVDGGHWCFTVDVDPGTPRSGCVHARAGALDSGCSRSTRGRRLAASTRTPRPRSARSPRPSGGGPRLGGAGS